MVRKGWVCQVREEEVAMGWQSLLPEACWLWPEDLLHLLVEGLLHLSPGK